MAEVLLPQLGETVIEGTITQWFKQVGDTVDLDEPLFEVSTDKVDTEVPSPIAGVVAEIRAAEGDTVDVGTVVAVVNSADTATAAQPAGEPGSPAAEQPSTPAPPPTPPATPASTSTATTLLLSPVVRRLVDDHGINPADVTGTGPGGRITRSDVTSFLQHGAPPPQPPSLGETDLRGKQSAVRPFAAAHISAVGTAAPHGYSLVDVDLTWVEAAIAHGTEPATLESVQMAPHVPFVVRALLDALAQFPYLNASVVGADLTVHESIHLAIGVDLDDHKAVAPVIRSAGDKQLAALSAEITGLINRAHARALGPHELQGATFTVAHSPAAGAVTTIPTVNPPQVAIVAVGVANRKPVVVDTPGGAAIAVRPVLTLSMSWDLRAFDAAYAAGFLNLVKQTIETTDWTEQR